MPYRQASTPGKKRPTFKKKQNWGLSKPQGLGQGTAGAEENLGGERGRGLRGGGGARRPTPQEPMGGTRRGDGGQEPATPRLHRGPASAPPPPVPFARGTQARRGEGERESQKKGGGGAGVLLSGTGRRQERGYRSTQFFLPLTSRPFSPCLRAGIAPRPRCWSARTVGPSGQRPGNRGRA